MYSLPIPSWRPSIFEVVLNIIEHACTTLEGTLMQIWKPLYIIKLFLRKVCKFLKKKANFYHVILFLNVCKQTFNIYHVRLSQNVKGVSI